MKPERIILESKWRIPFALGVSFIVAGINPELGLVFFGLVAAAIILTFGLWLVSK